LFTIIAACSAQQASIDIEVYKKSKKYAYTEHAYTIGKHSFKIVNVKSLAANADTSCISAIVLDKRKYVLFDIDVPTGAIGLFVPQSQPIQDGLIVLKSSPYEAKTFIILGNGKVMTLPGALDFVDSVGSCIYCVWDNDKTFRLTVFDYKNLRMVVKPTAIEQPIQWFSDGMSYGFTTAEKEYYSMDFMSRNIIKGEKPQGDIKEVPYLIDLDKVDRAKCCGPEVLKK
jgi:hypothetical protein